MSIYGEDWAFIHNPKCAGTNVKHMIRKYGTRYTGHVHKGLRDMPELHDKWTFAFVRNPYDRMVSLYEFIRKRLEMNSAAYYGWVHDITAANRPFKEWLMDSEFWEDNYGKDILLPVQKRSQNYFVTLDDETIAVDFVGKTETFISDMRVICNKLKIPLKNTNINSNPHDKYQAYYDNESREWIEKYFKWDLETFDYDY